MRIGKKLYRKNILQKVKDFVTFVYFLHYPYDEISFFYEMNLDKDITHIRIEPLGFIVVLSWLARLDIPQVYIVEFKEGGGNLKGCLYSLCEDLKVLKFDLKYVVYSLKKKYYIRLISNLLRYGFLDQFPFELYNLIICTTPNKKFYKSIVNLIEGKADPAKFLKKENLEVMIYIHDDDIFHLYIQGNKLNDLGINFHIEQYIKELNEID